MWYVNTPIDVWLRLYPNLGPLIDKNMVHPKPFVDGPLVGIEYDNQITIFTYRNKSDGADIFNKLTTLLG